MTGLTGLHPAPEAPVRTPSDGVGDSAGADGPRGTDSRSHPLRLVAVLAALVALGVLVGVPVLALVLALALSIFAHELGHFVAARASGMKVTEFFLGMGPRIWSFRRGEVEYGLKAVPLAAYVRIVGMNNLEEVDPADEPRTYRAQNYPRRLATVVAGPAVNIAIGVVLFFGLFATTGVADPADWSVGRVVPGGAAATAGVQPGDRIVAVDGERVASWEDFTTVLDSRAGAAVTLEVEREGQTLTLPTQLGWALTSAGAEALPTSPSLPAGTQVVAVDGEPVADAGSLATVLGTAGAPVELTLEVGDGTYRVELPRPVELPEGAARGFLGVTLDDAGARPVGVVGAAGEAVGMVGEVTTSMVDFLGKLFSPSGLARYGQMLVGGSDGADGATADLAPVEPVGTSAPVAADRTIGPDDDEAIRPLSLIGIVQVGGQLSGASGVGSVVFLLAMVNVFLGLINLVPLLPFDGGHAAVATYEALRGAVTRRPYRVDITKLMPVTYVVVAVLLGLGLSAMWLDITNPVQLAP